ncbi:hypothetical protein HZB07_03490 [Candidatus Saganbacteria bacterium]|nr:hypothetical protein [Candidatus Saganbacteria bacterium]
MFKQAIFIILLFSYFLNQCALADSELWSVSTFLHPINERLKLAVIPDLRFRNNASEWYFFRAFIGAQTALDKSWEGGAYVAPLVVKNGGNWTTSYLYYTDLTYKNGSLSNRARLEENSLSGVLKYWNSLQFKTADWTLGDDLFYNFAKGLFDEHRVGVSYGFGAFSLGYLLRMQKATAAADWIYTNVGAFGLKIVY